jgi:hypothetical protein
MATTSAIVYFRPTAFTARTRATEATVYFPLRVVSGLYSVSLAASAVTKNWKPSALTPLVDKDGRITPEWNRYFSDLGGRKLGGAIFPTLPEIAELFTQTQSNAREISAVQVALEQQATANAQALDVMRQVVQDAALAGATQIPTVVIIRQEVTAPPPQPVASYGGSDGSAGGD